MQCKYLFVVYLIVLCFNVIIYVDMVVLKSISWFKIKTIYDPIYERSHGGQGVGVAGGTVPLYFNFWNKQGPTVSVSNTRNIAYLTIIIVYVTIFEQSMTAFYFL